MAVLRFLTNHIIIDGTDRGMSVLELSDDRKRLFIKPFIKETHSTVFIPGTIHISVKDEKYQLFAEKLNKYL